MKAALDAVRAGEVFQVQVGQRFEAATAADALDVYRVLRTLNPSPYMYLLRLDGFDIVGCSPEALVTVTGGRAVLHPIAGTRPRGDTPERDAELAAELVGDGKERAEHVMLVDLARNDLGRVCAPGTVRVVEFGALERYSHVWHIVSTVTGEVAAGRDALDVLTACFPAGTLTGAPKVRAMELIDELEPVRRGVYGGAVGYLDADRRAGHGDRHPDRGDPGRDRVRAGVGGDRRGQRPGGGGEGDPQQGARGAAGAGHRGDPRPARGAVTVPAAPGEPPVS